VTAQCEVYSSSKDGLEYRREEKNEDGISLSIPCLNPTTIVKKGPRRGRAEKWLRNQKQDLPRR
jgi:hypothetical protein